MTGRRARQELIADLVAHHPVHSQAELVALLAHHGLDVTQATVSRDLDELGIDKIRGADGSVTYALPGDVGLAQLLRQFAIEIAASGNLAVVRTPPGAAGTIASAIDARALDPILATVQGDDTVLIVAREPHDGHHVAALLSDTKGTP